MTKYSPIRKVESGKPQPHYGEYHVPAKNTTKVNYIQQPVG